MVFDPLSLRESGQKITMFGLAASVSAASPRRVVRKKKKGKCVSPQKTFEIREKLSPKTVGAVNGLSQRKFPDL